MSTIFGIYKTDNKPVAEMQANKMHAAMEYWSADEKGLMLNGELFLGHLMLYNTPESINEKLPFLLNDLSITADCRLDNRDAIIKNLSDFTFISSTTPDSVLILFLYKKYYTNCLKYLEGDFVFAIYDRNNKFLFCARDRMGVKPFYYYFKNGDFVFASEQKGILGFDEADKTLNEKYIYELMANIEPELHETFYQFIFSLLPAHQLIVDKEGVKIEPYWKLEIPPLLYFKNTQDYVEAFQEEMTRAVKCRLRSAFPIATELSGGLDSSGITGLASKLIKDKSKLFTLSNVMPVDIKGDKEYDDEESYIDQVISFCNIQNVIKNRSSNWNYFLEPHDISLLVSNGVDPYNAWWQEPLRKSMSHFGLRTTLSGFPGDEAISNTGSFYYHDMLSEGKYFDFLKIVIMNKDFKLPLKKMIGQFIPVSILNRFRNQSSNTLPRKSFLADKKMENILLNNYEKRRSPLPAGYKEYLISRVTSSHTSLRMSSETAYGIRHRIEPRYPMADTRLLSFFLSIPSKYLGDPYQNRFLFRESMKGIIPESIRLRKDKKGAPMIYYWVENRAFAEEFYKWASVSGNSEKTGILKNLDFDKLISGYDKENKENYISNMFNPHRPYEIELILRFFSR